MQEIIFSVDFWKIAAPLFVGILTWFLNERSKLSWEQYKRKEESYKQLVLSTKGFTLHSGSKELKDNFLDQLNVCWLYAPDDVIEKGYNFLDSVYVGAETTQQEKQDAMGDFILSIRKDLLTRKSVKDTKLTKSSFKTLLAT